MHHGKRHTFHLAFLPLMEILLPLACTLKIIISMLNCNIPNFLPFQLSNPQTSEAMLPYHDQSLTAG